MFWVGWVSIKGRSHHFRKQPVLSFSKEKTPTWELLTIFQHIKEFSFSLIQFQFLRHGLSSKDQSLIHQLALLIKYNFNCMFKFTPSLISQGV